MYFKLQATTIKLRNGSAHSNAVFPSPLARAVMAAAERQRPAAMPSRPSFAPKQRESARGVVRHAVRERR